MSSTLGVHDIPVVCEYPDVFPKELPRVPPHREIEFPIAMVLGSGPISKAPYRMTPAKLRKLRKQLGNQSVFVDASLFEFPVWYIVSYKFF